MRYYKTSKKTQIFLTLKSVVVTFMTAVVFIAALKLFDTQIINSAVSLTIGNAVYSDSESETEYTSGFEDDFSKFVISNTKAETSTPKEDKIENTNAIAVNLSALSGKYKEYKGTSVINNTSYDISDLLYADYTLPTPNKDEPYILIYHTHTSEEYYGGGTVVDVGDAMAKEFERLGYKTIHLTDIYDAEQFSGAYSRSVEGAQQVLKKYPGIQLVFDVHRDAITTESGDTYRPITEINGKECAQVMFVCGTDSKGLKHMNWRENFKFALDVSRTAGKNFSALSRPVNLRKDRFNTHLTDYTFLIEMGSVANTLEEAKLAAVYTAQSIILTIEQK